MILEAVKAALDELCESTEIPMNGAYYGLSTLEKMDHWNYFVFNRMEIHTIESNSKSYMEHFQVHIIHEGFIPDEYEVTVIKAVKNAAKGISLAGNITYNYERNPQNGMPVEICTLHFKKAYKKDI